MGCSWFTYAGTCLKAEEGYILIPEYAQNWAGTDKIKILEARDYSEFKLENGKFIDGNMLIGIFNSIFEEEEVPLTLDQMYFDEHDEIYDSKVKNDLRFKGICSGAYTSLCEYSLKVVLSDEFTYEEVETFSPSGQLYEPLDDDDELLFDFENLLKLNYKSDTYKEIFD